MKEIIRRFVMMIGIVSVGTILIFFNTSIYITLTAALAFGIIMAMGLGLLKKEDFNRLKNLKIYSPKEAESEIKTEKKAEIKTEKKEPKKDKTPGKRNAFFLRFHKKDQNDVPTDKSKEQKKGRLSSGLSAALGSFNATVGKLRDKKHTEKIDTLLNSTINEPLRSSSGASENQSESSYPDVSGNSSDEMGFFDDEDFGSLDSLEIEGEETSCNLGEKNTTGSHNQANEGAGGLNLDDEINAILLAGNAYDEDDAFSLDDSNEILLVQGIEDGLDEESFITLPEDLTEKQHTGHMSDALDELNLITNFEQSNGEDDAFSDFAAIDLDQIEMDDLSLESDDIIIEEEEGINDNAIFPDDYIPSQDIGKGIHGSDKGSADDNSLSEKAGPTPPTIPEPISFSGKNEYDDILGILQSEIKTVKKLPSTSLMRDMKGVHVKAKDLEDDLESVLRLMGGKSRSTNIIHDRSEE
jgi:hypothetical protein